MRPIDADAFVAKLFDYAITDSDIEFSEDVQYAISKEPTLERPKGKWVEDCCSECGSPRPVKRIIIRGQLVWTNNTEPNFCPNCGVKMEV